MAFYPLFLIEFKLTELLSVLTCQLKYPVRLCNYGLESVVSRGIMKLQ